MTMSAYKQGDALKVVKVVHRSSGSAWPGEKVKVVAVEGDGLKVRMESGVLLDRVQDSEVEQA